MNTTNQLGLLKPELTDPADITVLNENWDNLDNTLTQYDTKLTSLTNMAGIASYSTGSPSQTWQWRKWNNGIAECWYTRVISTNIAAADGALYSNVGGAATIQYPFTFIETPCETVSLAGATGSVWLATNAPNTNTQTGNYLMCSTQQKGITEYRINYYVIGRWK